MVRFSKSLAVHSDELQSKPVILCIVKDLTDSTTSCKKEIFNLSNTFTISQFLSEVAVRYGYQVNTFNLMWKLNNDSLNLTNPEYGLRTLGEIGLQDDNHKNVFEIHEKDDGPPVRLIKSEVSDYILDEEPKIDDIEVTSSTQHNMFRPFKSHSGYNSFYGDAISSTGDNGSGLGGLSSIYSDSYADTGFVGLINQAMTCYLNSLLQTLYMTPEFRNAIYRWQYKGLPQPQNQTQISVEQIAAAKKNIPYQLQKLFLQLQTSSKKCVQTQDLTQSFGWGSDDAFQQHDVQELCRVMFDALEKMFKGTEQENLITELYQGKLKDYVKCLECESESARVDVYLDIQLTIKAFTDESGYNYKLYDSIEKALMAYIEPETLDDANKYNCDKCKKLCKAHKGIIFETFPYILCLQLKRFDFDYRTMMRIKLNHSVTFPEVLDVKPYLAESTLQANPDVKTEYELFSIMIHSGNATGGHYYAYIKDFQTSSWYNFNDDHVNRLDPTDIKKSYGLSYSSLSSTTAYMLLYRQIDTKRNELFITKDTFPSHINDLQVREQLELKEAERLKEYTDNLCKIKAILVNTNKMDLFKQNETLYPEKMCNLHKDLTLEQAKLELFKEFSVESNVEQSSSNTYVKTRTRIVKYDLYNEHIEHSFDDEKVTVFEALNFLKQNYGYCWIFEVNNDTTTTSAAEFVSYKPSSVSIKFIETNSNTYETRDLFNLRVENDITILELLFLINSKLGIVQPRADQDDVKYVDDIVDKINLALERPNNFSPYLYLNDHLNKSLVGLGFLKSNKIFIDYKRPSTTTDEQQAVVDERFNKKNFFHVLQTITNLIQVTCFLPNSEQCAIYKHKLTRRLQLLENKRVNLQNSYYSGGNENLLSYDEVMRSRSAATASTSIGVAHSTTATASVSTSPPLAQSSAGLSFNKRRNACINPIAYEEDEDELDFGNVTHKVLKQKSNDTNMSSGTTTSESCSSTSNGMLKRRFSDELSKSVDNIMLKTSKLSTDITEDMSISSPLPAVASSEPATLVVSPSAVNLRDIEVDVIVPATAHAQTRRPNLIIDMETSLDEGIGSGSSPSHIKNSPNSLDNLRGSPDPDTNLDDIDSAVTSTTAKFPFEGPPIYDDNDCDNVGTSIEVAGDDCNSDVVDNLSTNNDHYGPYSQTFNDNENSSDFLPSNGFQQNEEDWDRDCELDTLNKKFNFNGKAGTNENEDDVDSPLQETFIKSVLITNDELETRTLEITMDKLITLIDFKRHIKSYINVNIDDFRIYRVSPNDFETELTRNENQFQYILHNSKFITKLGPALKYGEYSVQVFKLIKNVGFTFLCEFMIEHGVSVYNHKMLLREDIKDECNEDVPLERMRLRKKVLNHPSTVLLDEQIFGRDVFINSSSELCIEIIDGAEPKTEKSKIAIYVRKWDPSDYSLSAIEEIIIDGQTLDVLLKAVSQHSSIDQEHLEILRCKREYPYRLPLLDIHRDCAWRENYLLHAERIDDGYCYYYRDKRQLLGELSDEKRRELSKESLKSNSSTSFSSVSSSSYYRKETGVKIHI